MRFDREGSGLGRALLANYLYRLGAAALLALPVVVGIGASGIGEFAEGDGKLFEPGALYLLEVLSQQGKTLVATVPPVLLASLVFALGSVAPESLLLRAVWRRARALGAPPRARQTLPRLLAVGVAAWLARIALVLVTLALAMTARSYAASALDERVPLLVQAGVVALGLLAQGGVSVLRDVALLDVVGRGAHTSAAVGHALVSLRHDGLRLAAAYAATTLASAALFMGALAVSSGLETARDLPALTGLALHQLAIAGSIGLRAVWLCAARRVFEPRTESGSGGRVLVDLEVTPRGGLPAQVEAQQPPGEPGPGGVPESREATRDGAE